MLTPDKSIQVYARRDKRKDKHRTDAFPLDKENCNITYLPSV